MRNDAEKVTRTCDACGGHGTVVVVDVDVHCDSCDGRGVVDDDSTDPANDVAFCGWPVGEWDRCTRPADHEGACA